MSDAELRGIRFQEATPELDGALRALTRECASGGEIELRLEKEPSYFGAQEVEGTSRSTLVGEDLSTGKLAAVGNLSTRDIFFNGEAARAAYISGLKIPEDYRHGTLLARGYRALGEIHKRHAPDFCLTTVMKDNVTAQTLLRSGRAGLPLYQEIGEYVTLAFRPTVLKRISIPSLKIRSLRPSEHAELLDFLNRNGPKRQFFPRYTAQDLSGESGLLKGLSDDCIYVARESGKIVGTLALWDQQPFRQWVVHRYSGRARWMRHPYNWLSKLTSLPVLPPPGKELDQYFLSLMSIEGDRTEVLESLLGAISKHDFRRGRAPVVFAGFHQNDPLLPCFGRVRCLRFRSTVFLVNWDRKLRDISWLKERVPFLDPGSL